MERYFVNGLNFFWQLEVILGVRDEQKRNLRDQAKQIQYLSVVTITILNFVGENKLKNYHFKFNQLIFLFAKHTQKLSQTERRHRYSGLFKNKVFRKVHINSIPYKNNNLLKNSFNHRCEIVSSLKWSIGLWMFRVYRFNVGRCFQRHQTEVNIIKWLVI